MANCISYGGYSGSGHSPSINLVAILVVYVVVETRGGMR